MKKEKVEMRRYMFKKMQMSILVVWLFSASKLWSISVLWDIYLVGFARRHHL